MRGSVWNLLDKLRGEAGADGPVFVSRKGATLIALTVLRIVKNAAVRAGHRVTSVTALVSERSRFTLSTAGSPIYLVQDTLGHASINTTGRYLHARPNEA